MQHISFIAELDLLMHAASFPISCLSVSVRMVILRERGWGTAALATANNNAKKITNLKNGRAGSKLGMYTASAGPLPWIVSSLTSSSLHFPSCIWSVIQKHKTQISQVDHLLVSGNNKSACFKISNKITLTGRRPPEWKIKYFVFFKVGVCQR